MKSFHKCYKDGDKIIGIPKIWDLTSIPFRSIYTITFWIIYLASRLKTSSVIDENCTFLVLKVTVKCWTFNIFVQVYNFFFSKLNFVILELHELKLRFQSSKLHVFMLSLKARNWLAYFINRAKLITITNFQMLADQAWTITLRKFSSSSWGELN